ncbi:hypothetical protein SLA2020_401720 [Shorea laevis]
MSRQEEGRRQAAATENKTVVSKSKGRGAEIHYFGRFHSFKFCSSKILLAIHHSPSPAHALCNRRRTRIVSLTVVLPLVPAQLCKCAT